LLDPLVRLHRVDEIQSAAIAPLLASLREIQRKHNCAVALVHHARKGASAARAGQALRGSSELHAWGDSNLYVRRQKGRLWLSAEHRAQPSSGTFGLQLKTDDDVIALVADNSDLNDDSRSQTTSVAHNPSTRERVLEALNSFNKPVRMRCLRNACRIRAESLSAVLHEMVDSGEVIRSEDGWALANPKSDTDVQAQYADPDQLHISV